MISRGTALRAGAVLLALFLVWWLVTLPGRHRQAAAEARATTSLAQARSSAAAEAVAIIDQGAQRDAETDTITRENADAIRTAPGADVRLDPGLNAAGLRGLCRRAAYRDAPECVQRPGAGVASQAGAWR